MPILLHIDDVEPGMQLASNVVNSFSVLLPHGRILSENDIQALRRRFPDLHVQVLDPLLDQVIEFESTGKDQETSLKVRKTVSQVTSKVSAVIRNGVALDGNNVKGIESVVQEMLAYICENPVTTAIIEQSNSWDDYLQEHSANVFYLSLLIGNTVKNYIKQERERLTSAATLHNAMDLLPLATGAILHDIGMAPLEHLYHKVEPLTEQEKAAIRAHPKNGADALPDRIDPMVKQIVRQHHENQQGDGYPDGLSGDRIGIFARIVRVADAYSAAISQKVYQNAKNPVCVLYEMIHGDYSEYYDPILLKVFASMMQPLPIGAKIKLQDGRWAVVVRHNRKDPFRPEIIIAFDELGDPIDKENLQRPMVLGVDPKLKVESFMGHDISFINALCAVSDISATEKHHIARECRELFDLAYP
ncbi:MAG: HD domain-containing protein [Sedimentisphaerales bacterium]|nr:HD domain-containing protein [Sedimentisphaerales bacterium]